MREITCQAVTQAVRDLCIRANVDLPEDLRERLRQAQAQEVSPVGRNILQDIVDNFTLAGERGLPICQDTGMAVLFVDLGQEVCITGGDLEEAVNLGVAQGYTQGFLRKSVVRDPLRRVNTEDNTPAVLHLRLVPGDRLTITAAPKGFGSENMTALHMLRPTAAPQEVVEAIVRTVERAGSNPCPPVLVGVGLGGTAEKALELSKRALLRQAGAPNPDPFYAELEKQALEKINRLGIGPQGLGGSVTALGVAIEPWPTHIAGLPCGVSIGCHVTRHASVVL